MINEFKVTDDQLDAPDGAFVYIPEHKGWFERQGMNWVRVTVLACKECNAPHDLDMGPDEGVCMICGGDLIEDESERELVGGSGHQRRLQDLL
jgi:hypothetical protein